MPLIKGKKIAVTGGCGFIGSNIAQKLAAHNQVMVIDNLESGSLKHLEEFKNQVEFIEADIRQPETLKGILDEVDIVFHHAAYIFVTTSVDKPEYDAQTNVMGTINLLNECRRAGVRRVVFAASSAVYGPPEYQPIDESHPLNPDSPYAASKLSCEYYLKLWYSLYGIETVCLRYFNVYGPRQDSKNPYSGVIAIFTQKMLQGEPLIIYGDGEQTRDFIFIDDIVQANIQAAIHPQTPGQVINIGTGRAISLNDLCQVLKKHQPNLQIEYQTKRLGDVDHSLGNVTKAEKLINFKASISIEEGLKKYINWFNQQG